jgi:tetratricopeptide (TPR) repeat protein
MADTAQICSQCGWSFDMEALKKNTCKKCQSVILVCSVAYLEKFEKPAIQKYITQYSQTLKSDPQNHDALLAIGICYLKLGLYEISEKFFDKIIDLHPISPSGYYYRAICIFKGNRPRIASLPLTRKAEQLIKTSIELEPGNGCYSIVLAAIKHDYYASNGMKMPDPTPDVLIADAKSKHLDKLEIKQMISLLKIQA